MSLKDNKFVWLNGNMVDWNKATVHCLSHTLHYASGAFEGIRLYKTRYRSAIFRLDEHITRLIFSLSAFHVESPWSNAEIKQAIIDTIKVNNLLEGYIRPIFFFGPETVQVDPRNCSLNLAIIPVSLDLVPHNNCLRLTVSSFKRISNKATFVDRKLTGNYINSVLAGQEAKLKGFDDALMLDENNNIAECPIANFFIVSQGILKTPKLGSIFGGITRDSIIELAKNLNIKVLEIDLTLSDLEVTTEAFVSGTAMGVTQVSQIDDHKFLSCNEASITNNIRDSFFNLIFDEQEKYKNWFTFLPS